MQTKKDLRMYAIACKGMVGVRRMMQTNDANSTYDMVEPQREGVGFSAHVGGSLVRLLRVQGYENGGGCIGFGRGGLPPRPSTPRVAVVFWLRRVSGPERTPNGPKSRNGLLTDPE